MMAENDYRKNADSLVAKFNILKSILWVVVNNVNVTP
jgi:hypothetical protein